MNTSSRTQRAITSWNDSRNQLASLTERIGHFPTHADFAQLADTREAQRLERWLWRQRATNKLTNEQTEALSAIPGFEWDPRGTAWEARFAALSAFINEHDRRPRFRAATAVERSLADWHARQLRRLAAGQLSHDRAIALRCQADSPRFDVREPRA